MGTGNKQMVETTTYFSKEFRSMPDNFGHLAIYISEFSCTIGVSTPAQILVALVNYQRDSSQFPHHFFKEVYTKQAELLQRKFKHVTIGVETANFTLLPNEVQLNNHEVIEFVTGSPTRQPFTQTIEQLKSDLVFSLPQQLVQEIEEQFPESEIKHCHQFGIEQLLASNDDALVVFDHQYIDVYVQQENQLISAARQFVETDEDVLYFVLLALQDANIDAQKANIRLSGIIKRHSSTYSLLSNYIGDLRVAVGDLKMKTLNDFDAPLQDHEYLVNLLHENN